ncbi:hypothetical protein BHU72_04805 [Desulfuribacillus stibiiarsenatis]|uniref:Rhodanese domain-containing protein n=2 Tax=Desulfuribacillus stibiiarsenatis TaxID=1390249 RepID=A0A1E5L5Y0_9FIRM|nr:hypothetical protein BHU72_04805 [Desulfuribacillus stibiiarsenatis]
MVGCNKQGQETKAELSPVKQEQPNTSAASQELKVDEFAILQAAAQEYVQRPLMLMSTDEVYQKAVVEKNSEYQLISTRYEEDYNRGHIEGAEWITRTEFAKEETLNRIDKNRKTILYCYTASGATYVSAMLNLMGYEAYGMSIGMTEWTANREVAGTQRTPVAIENYPIESAEYQLQQTYPLPKLTTGKTSVEEIVHEMGMNYFASGKARWISAEEIKVAYDTDALEEFILIDVRDKSKYDKGHVPKAVNIAYRQTMDMTNLQKLPTDKKLIIISEDGQSATQIAALYSFLGYDARTMLYGMLAWSNDPNVVGTSLWKGPRNYPWVGSVKP